MKLFDEKRVVSCFDCLIDNGTFYGRKELFKYWTMSAILLASIFSGMAVSAQSKPKKVVMISIDGTPDYLIDKFLKNGVLPPDGAFAKMKKFGAYAKTLLPINVASTGPSHIAIFTGAQPSRNGVIGNAFRRTNQRWESPSLSAFKQEIKTETIFQAAMRQGKKVIALGGVGLDNADSSRRTDYLHVYPLINAGPSLVIDLQRTVQSVSDKNKNRYFLLSSEDKSPSPATLEIFGGSKTSLTIYQKDTIPNSTVPANFPAEIIIDDDTDINNGYLASLSSDEWKIISIKDGGREYNSSIRLLKSDNSKGTYRLFISAPGQVLGYPEGFLQKMQSSIGLWPGEPENRKQTSGLIPENIWFEQVDNLAAYSKNLILKGMKEDGWDLLFGYFSTLDDVQHRYTLTNPLQLDFSAENGKRPGIYAGYIEKYFRMIDAYLTEIMDAAPKETNFIIFSDHGMIPTHTTLLLNNYLELAKFNISGNDIKSVSSGNSAHIYINKDNISQSGYSAYLNRLKENLKSLKDPKTGKRIFELVADQKQQAKIGLYHQDYSGDLFVSCKGGYTISDRKIKGVSFLVQNSFDPAMFENQNQPTKDFLISGTMNETGRGVHGSLASLREGQSIFYAIGPNIPKKGLGKIYSLQIASTVAKLLEIKSPRNTIHQSLF